MRVGVPKETAQDERRVALVPEAVARLSGFEVVVEPGAGTAAGFTDEAYREAGAQAVEGFRNVMLGIMNNESDRAKFARPPGARR